MNTESKETKLTTNKVIDIIRTVRNDLIKDFLADNNLVSYFEQNYNVRLSNIKTEFLKKDLKELLIAPVDLVHYATLISRIRESNSASLSQGYQEIFYNELETIFKKYNY